MRSWPKTASRLRWFGMTAVAMFVVAGATTMAVSIANTHQREALAARSSISRSLRHSFRVFRHGTVRANSAAASTGTAGQSLPSSIATSWTAGDPYQINTALAREVAVTPSVTAWVAPGASGACLAWVTTQAGAVGGSGCAPTNIVQSGGDWGESYNPAPPGGPDAPPAGPVTVAGVAPDGNTTVTIVASDGTSQTVPVVQNVYVWTGQAVPRAITLRDASGETQTDSLIRGQSSG